MLRRLKSLGYSVDRSYALGFLSVLVSIAIWFTQGGTGDVEAAAAGERFGIFVGLWAPTFMAIGDGMGLLQAWLTVVMGSSSCQINVFGSESVRGFARPRSTSDELVDERRDRHRRRRNQVHLADLRDRQMGH